MFNGIYTNPVTLFVVILSDSEESVLPSVLFYAVGLFFLSEILHFAMLRSRMTDRIQQR